MLGESGQVGSASWPVVLRLKANFPGILHAGTELALAKTCGSDIGAAKEREMYQNRRDAAL
jgi:hypothetical protein